MNKAVAFLLSVIFLSYLFVQADDLAVLVYNTLQDIEKCNGKLQLKLVCIW